MPWFVFGTCVMSGTPPVIAEVFHSIPQSLGANNIYTFRPQPVSSVFFSNCHLVTLSLTVCRLVCRQCCEINRKLNCLVIRQWFLVVVSVLAVRLCGS